VNNFCLVSQLQEFVLINWRIVLVFGEGGLVDGYFSTVLRVSLNGDIFYVRILFNNINELSLKHVISGANFVDGSRC
jgi:hypothetical protein